VVVTRGVSTVLDASLAVLLVSAAAVVLVTVPGGGQQPPNPDAAAQTVLASTVTVEYGPNESRTASGRVSTLAAHAAVAAERGGNPEFVAAVGRGTDRVIRDSDGRIELVAATGDTVLRFGPRPPASASVAATTHRVTVNETTVRLTIRVWSP
jgi:hypothetical protein